MQDDSKDSKKFDKIDEFPSEFECCFCTTKVESESTIHENFILDIAVQ